MMNGGGAYSGVTNVCEIKEKKMEEGIEILLTLHNFMARDHPRSSSEK